jgi:hypothetical protein
MNKIRIRSVIAGIAACAVLPLSISCGTTKKAAASADTEGTSLAKTNTTDTGTQTAADSTDLSRQAEAAKERHVTTVQRTSGLMSFLTGLNAAPVELKASSLFTYNIMGTNVKPQDVQYFYFPDKKYVAAQQNTMLGKEYIYFDEEARAKIRSGYRQYLADFEAHRLNKKDSSSYNAYGEYKGKLSYGILTGRETAAYPVVSVGYKFIKDSPYFTLTQWPAEEIVGSVQSDTYETTPKETLLFNKALAADLTDQFDEDMLSSYVVESKRLPTKDSKTSYGDAY